MVRFLPRRELSPNIAFILILFVLWTGFLVRPFGAIVFGHLGDLIGRKFTVMLTLLLMGVATFVAWLQPDRRLGTGPSGGDARAAGPDARGPNMAGPPPTSRSTRPTASGAFIRAGFKSSPQRSALYSSGTTLSLRGDGTALRRGDEALKIKF